MRWRQTPPTTSGQQSTAVASQRWWDASVQPYKYYDKELDLTAGMSRYDYSARAYYAAIPRFDRPDALADKGYIEITI